MTDDLAPTPAEQEARATLEAYHATFTSADGLRVLLDLERQFYYGRTSLIKPQASLPVDAFATMYAEGQRAAVLHIKAQVAKAKLAKVEPTQTHAVSSTATKEP